MIQTADLKGQTELRTRQFLNYVNMLSETHNYLFAHETMDLQTIIFIRNTQEHFFKLKSRMVMIFFKYLPPQITIHPYLPFKSSYFLNIPLNHQNQILFTSGMEICHSECYLLLSNKFCSHQL